MFEFFQCGNVLYCNVPSLPTMKTHAGSRACVCERMPSLPLGNSHFQLFTLEQVWTALIKMSTESDCDRGYENIFWPCKQGLQCKSAAAGGGCTLHALRSSEFMALQMAPCCMCCSPPRVTGYTQMVMRGCQERCETLMFQVSGLSMDSCSLLNVSEWYIYSWDIYRKQEGPQVTAGS